MYSRVSGSPIQLASTVFVLINLQAFKRKVKLESNFQHVYPLVLYVSCMPASRICRLQNSFYLLTTSSWQQKTIVHNIKIKEVMYNLEVRNIKLYQMLKLYYCYNYNSQQQLKQYVYYSSWIMFNSLKLVTFPIFLKGNVFCKMNNLLI